MPIHIPRLPVLVLAAIAGTVLVSARGAERAQVERIDGRNVESITWRQPGAGPVVVFENGSRATLDSWQAVLDALRPDATLFAYNRPGYGNSEATDSARDGSTIVEQLRATLKRKGLAPPYVLVGHSLGGLYMQLFARRYPAEVKGLVLVDALYPGIVKKPEDFPFTTRVGKWLFFSNTVQREIDMIHATGETVLALPGIDDKPIVRLVNRPLSAGAVAVDFGAFNLDAQTRTRVRGMYPKAKTVVADSSHQMQLTSPDLVAGAIREMLAAPTLPAPANDNKDKP